MSEKDKKDVAEMVKTAKYLAKKDPLGLALAKNTIDTLKARADMEMRVEDPEDAKDNTET